MQKNTKSSKEISMQTLLVYLQGSKQHLQAKQHKIFLATERQRGKFTRTVSEDCPQKPVERLHME